MRQGGWTQGSCCSTARAEAKALETGEGLPVEDRGTAQVGGFGWSGAHFGQVGEEDSAEVDVVAAAAVEPGAVGGPAVVVVAAAELPAVAAGISVAAAAG